MVFDSGQKFFNARSSQILNVACKLMKNRNPLIIFISYIVLGLILQSIIFYLFPFTGIGGIICYPFCVILSIAFGWALFKLTKRSIPKVYIFIAFFSFQTIQFYFELKIHPQDFGGSPISQINDFKKALNNYDEIKFGDFGSLTKSEKVIYSFKYKDNLPKSISTLTIFRNELAKQYDISNYENDSISYDKDKIDFAYTDTTIIIIENPKSTNKILSEIPFKTLLKQKGGGYLDRKSSTDFSVNESDFTFKTGIESVFYSYLKMTKKASRLH